MNMRASGMGMEKLPLFVWGVFITAWQLLLSQPVLAGKFVPAINLAVCWELLDIQDNQQVTLSIQPQWNLNDCAPGLSISKNIYETKQDIKEINYVNQIEFYKKGSTQNNNSNFFKCPGSYLAGLIEGDGCIVVPKQERSIKGKLNYPSIQIVFQLKDFPLASMISKWIGHGSISKKKQSAAQILTINNQEGLIIIIKYINGKMRGPKINQQYKLIDNLNKRITIGDEIPKKPIDKSPLGSNAWQAGFIEADGSFQVRTSLKSKYPKLGLSFEITQSRITHYGYNTQDIMEKIADLLEVKVNFLRGDKKHPQYRVRTSSVKSNLIQVNYQLKYNLYGSKYMDFKDWRRILSQFEQNIHYKNISCIHEIKSQMNQNRTTFNWDHI